MATTGEFCFQPHPDDIQGNGNAEYPGTKAEDVGIIVLAAHASSYRLVTKSGPNLPMTIGSDGHTDTRAADENAAITRPFDHRLTYLIGKFRVINGLIGKTADIIDRVSSLFKETTKFAFKLNAAMITTKRNIHGQFLQLERLDKPTENDNSVGTAKTK